MEGNGRRRRDWKKPRLNDRSWESKNEISGKSLLLWSSDPLKDKKSTEWQREICEGERKWLCRYLEKIWTRYTCNCVQDWLSRSRHRNIERWEREGRTCSCDDDEETKEKFFRWNRKVLNLIWNADRIRWNWWDGEKDWFSGWKRYIFDGSKELSSKRIRRITTWLDEQRISFILGGSSKRNRQENEVSALLPFLCLLTDRNWSILEHRQSFPKWSLTRMFDDQLRARDSLSLEHEKEEKKKWGEEMRRRILEKKKWSLLWKFWSMNKGPDCFHSPTDKVRSTINLIGLMRNNESVFVCLNFTFRLFAIDTIRTDSLIDVIVVDPFCNCRILQHKPNLTITDQQFNEPLTRFHSLLVREANEKIDAGEKRRERMLTIDGHSDLQTSLTSTSYFTRFRSHCTKVHTWCWSSTHHARQRLR